MTDLKRDLFWYETLSVIKFGLKVTYILASISPTAKFTELHLQSL